MRCVVRSKKRATAEIFKHEYFGANCKDGLNNEQAKEE
jgi:hypothetical protein